MLQILSIEMVFSMPPHLTPVVLLFVSNIFMTTAWYGHLKFPTASMVAAVLVRGIDGLKPLIGK